MRVLSTCAMIGLDTLMVDSLVLRGRAHREADHAWKRYHYTALRRITAVFGTGTTCRMTSYAGWRKSSKRDVQYFLTIHNGWMYKDDMIPF